MIELILTLVTASTLLGAWCGYGLAKDRHATELRRLQIAHAAELNKLAIRKLREGAAKSRMLDLAAALDAQGMRTHQEN